MEITKLDVGTSSSARGVWLKMEYDTDQSIFLATGSMSVAKAPLSNLQLTQVELCAMLFFSERSYNLMKKYIPERKE